MLTEEQMRARKAKNKKTLKLVLYVSAGLMVVGMIGSYFESRERSAIQEEQRKQQEIADARNAVLKRRHDSLMSANPEYADSVTRAEARKRDSVAKQKREDSIAAVERDRITNPENHLEVDIDWRKGGFGAVALAEFTFVNKSLMTLENPKVKVRFSSSNGTIISSREVDVYVTVKPGKRARSKEVNLGFVNDQVERAGCELVTGTWK